MNLKLSGICASSNNNIFCRDVKIVLPGCNYTEISSRPGSWRAGLAGCRTVTKVKGQKCETSPPSFSSCRKTILHTRLKANSLITQRIKKKRLPDSE